ncbi:MAG: DUF2892 domain-containing protein [Pseudomonadota bacterium]
MNNIGNLDRAIRFIVGIVLIAAPFVAAGDTGFMGAFGGYGWVALLIGAVLVITAAFRFCPAYRLLGIRTCPVSKGRSSL